MPIQFRFRQSLLIPSSHLVQTHFYQFYFDSFKTISLGIPFIFFSWKTTTKTERERERERKREKEREREREGERERRNNCLWVFWRLNKRKIWRIGQARRRTHQMAATWQRSARSRGVTRFIFDLTRRHLHQMMQSVAF